LFQVLIFQLFVIFKKDIFLKKETKQKTKKTKKYFLEMKLFHPDKHSSKNLLIFQLKKSIENKNKIK